MNIFPITRLRRSRQSDGIRKLFDLPPPPSNKFIWPVFVSEGRNIKEPLQTMPGQYKFGIDTLLKVLEPIADKIGGILLFGVIPQHNRNDKGTYSYDEKGIIQKTIRKLRRTFSELIVCTDVCLCAYTKHGHCGILSKNGSVDNELTNAILAKIAVSHAYAGAQVVAPSAMMDGQVTHIRSALDKEGFTNTLIMSYSTKFASSMYGPFRDVEQSAPRQGNRKGYQASFKNLNLAIRESLMDELEGADILMVKPALFYLDIISQLRQITHLPIATYNVSGEYSMLHAAAEKGYGELYPMVYEALMAIWRTGVDIIISYWANQYSSIFRNEFS